MMLWAIEWNPSEILFQIGPIGIRWYSLMFALGFGIGYWMMRKIFIHEKKNPEVLDTLLLYIVIGTVLGARLGHCLFYDWDYFKDHPLEIFLPVTFEPEFRFIGYRGLASHGGAIGVALALWLFSRKYRMPLLWLMDRIAIPVALTGAFIRIGNLMNSEIIGKPTDVPWAFVFRRIDDIPRHPVQLYESIAYFIIFILLYTAYWKTSLRFRRGALLGWFFVLVFGARFVLEVFKRSQGGIESWFGNALSTGQILSIPFILIGAYLIYQSRKISSHPR